MKYKLLVFLFIAAHIVCTAMSGPSCRSAIIVTEKDSSAKEIVEQAVFSLLESISPSKHQVKYVLNSSKLFVPKCNLCAGSKAAFQRYLRQADTIPTPEYAVLFSSSDQDARFNNLQMMVETAMKQYFSNHVLSPEERTAIRERLKAERLRSMNTLHVKKCATCDAVADE